MKKAVQFGAGNIGRGFMGQLLWESGYEIVFIDVDEKLVQLLNEQKTYPIRIVTQEKSREIEISNIKAVNGLDFDKVADEISTADLILTAVGVNVLPKIVKPLVMGLKKRWQSGNEEPVNLIICENAIGADKMLDGLIRKDLKEEQVKLYERTLGLVEASIGRMVPIMTDEMKEDNPLRIWVEEYSQLPVNKGAIKGEVPPIKGLIPFSPFKYYIQRKLYIHNAGHAILAYLGFLKGYRFIWEAAEDSVIREVCSRGLQESASALSREHGIYLSELYDHIEDLLFRFGNKALGDTIERVGKDPVRKLSSNDRLIGACMLAMKNDVKPVNLILGTAAGLLFKPDNDPGALKIQEMIRENGPGAVTEEICGLYEMSPLRKMILTAYDKLKAGNDLKEAADAVKSVEEVDYLFN